MCILPGLTGNAFSFLLEFLHIVRYLTKGEIDTILNSGSFEADGIKYQTFKIYNQGIST